MTRPSRSGSARTTLQLLGLAVLLTSAGVSRAHEEDGQPGPHGSRSEARYLFICTGDQARSSPDFLAVVNFDEDSADYGKVIGRAPLPEPGASG
ncbi:MAG: hypothetical protein E6K44_00330, partial [Gammaproteobacteria bacterium]